MRISIIRDGSLVVTISVAGDENDSPEQVAQAYKEVVKELNKKEEN